MATGKRLFITFFLILFLNQGIVSAQDIMNRPVRLMFYNVENLFDIYDDTARDDDEFTPGGVRKWNSSRYHRKINSIFKTIVAAGSAEPPYIVAMCEVENRNVLEDLIYGTNLTRYRYRIIHEDSPDLRGIDVCLLYRADSMKLIDYKYWIPDNTGEGDFSTRSVLYAKMSFRGDTMHLIVNHWPSRSGGVLARANLRNRISSMVAAKTDSLIRWGHSGAKILITGDFNCTPDDGEMRSLVSLRSGGALVNLSAATRGKDSGTYRYMGSWEMIDQMIVSAYFIKSTRGLYTRPGMVTIFNPPFLLMEDPRYPGLRPYSTYYGYRYQGGFSDHLPLLLDIGFR